jgi:mannonate dehydratase
MKETWRWFGPQDAISLEQVRQTGATGVVTALHHLYHGEAWPLEEVMKRKAEIEAHGLVWSVVESIPVHKSIKLRSGPYKQYIEWWQKTLEALGKAGIRIVCYNFMPGVDWTRTDLKWRLPSGALALRFDAVDFPTYDLFVLKRTSAEGDYRDDDIARAYARFKGMSEDRQKELEQTIIAGLPASEVAYNRDTFTLSLEEYKSISANDLRSNLTAFLQEVVPVAEENGIRLAIHPDDPPWPLLGLPRIVSTASDVRAILNGCDSPSDGLTFCVGSFGARAGNDLLAMVDEFAPRIYFAHLRQVMREGRRLVL